MSKLFSACYALCQWGRQVTIPPSYLDIGMGGHFEGFGESERENVCLCSAVHFWSIYGQNLFWINMKKALLILALAFMSFGCASITRGTDETFVIQTLPAGASARLSNGLFCTTPCSLIVSRKGSFTVTLEKEGYEAVMTSVVSKRDGAGTAGMAGNLVVGGIIGMGVDAATGAMNSHVPNPLVVTLVELDEDE